MTDFHKIIMVKDKSVFGGRLCWVITRASVHKLLARIVAMSNGFMQPKLHARQRKCCFMTQASHKWPALGRWLYKHSRPFGLGWREINGAGHGVRCVFSLLPVTLY